jgi:hypothetical protein
MAEEASPPHASEVNRKRKPYATPRIVSREPLEAMASICRPVPPAKTNAAVCPSGPSNS